MYTARANVSDDLIMCQQHLSNFFIDWLWYEFINIAGRTLIPREREKAKCT